MTGVEWAEPTSAARPDIDHWLDVTGYRFRFVCKAPAGSACNTGCVELCNQWGETGDCPHDQTRDLGYCCVVTWLDECDGDELAEDDHERLPLAIRWDGDNYRWRVVGSGGGS